MFLWIIVIVMALALAAEVFSLVGMAVVAVGAARRATLIKNEVMEKLQPSLRMANELKQSLRPDYERLRRDGGEIVKMLGARFRSIRAVWQDASSRAERLRLRLRREGGATVEQLQRDRQVVSRGVLEPIRTAANVAMGVRSAAWLLRKVA